MPFNLIQNVSMLKFKTISLIGAHFMCSFDEIACRLSAKSTNVITMHL